MDIGRLPPGTGIGERPTLEQSRGQPRDTPPETPERSLVPLAGRSDGERREARPARPSVAFLAHLIATAQHAPQTRARSRAEPADAIATYINGMKVSGAPRGKELDTRLF
jgi:hypothetical protein